MDDQHRARQIVNVAQQRGAGVLHTTSMPAASYEQMLSGVMQLQPPKRKNWTCVLGNTSGQHTRVPYIGGGVQVPGTPLFRTLRTT